MLSPLPATKPRAMWLVNENSSVADIEVPAERPDLAKLRRHGVLLVRNVLTAQEVRTIRTQVEAVVATAFRENRHAAVDPRYPATRCIGGDLLSMPALRESEYVMLDSRLVAVARCLLGDDIVYFGDSSIRVGSGGRGFHKDFIDPVLGPTEGGLRFVLYLQDHALTSGGLKVRLGSHRFTSRHFGRMLNVPTELGDLVVFYLRCSHTGHNVRLRGLPNLCLHPKLENLVPRPFQIALTEERIGLLWTLAAPGPHIHRYIAWIARDPRAWRSFAYNPRYVELAARRGVRLIQAVPEHGLDVP